VGTIRDEIAEARRRLREAAAEAPGREARLLLGSLLGWSEAALLARDDEPLPGELSARFRELVARREHGEPVAYLLGRREFYGRDFAVDARVLIPRPETEELVAIALALPLPDAARALDLGTGSGAIALTLAAERPTWRLVATDLSLGALACARRNRARLGLDDRVELAAADLAGALRVETFDLVVSNPPYVDPDDEALVAAHVRIYEPSLALFAGDRGFARIEGLLDGARALRAGAFLAFEIGFGQLDRALALAAARPWLELVEVRDDAARIPRDVVFKSTGAR
jgi:release factor glutamine methyltransferase